MKARRLLLTVLLVGLLGMPVAAVAYDLDDDLATVKAEIDAAAARIDQSEAAQGSLASRILASKSTLDTLVAELTTARAELTTAQNETTARREELAVVRAQLKAQYDALARTRTELASTKEATGRWAQELYMNAGDLGITEVVFTVDHINDIAIGMEYLDLIAKRDEQTVARLESLQVQEDRQRVLIEEHEAAVEADVEALAAVEALLDELAAELATRTAAVEAELANQRSLLAQLEAEEAFFRGELAALEAEQDEIEQLIAERQSQGGVAPGILTRPVPGPITSPFGYRLHPILGIQRLHTGADMSGAFGTPIVAAAAGTVIHATGRGGYGNTVMIDHGGGMVTLYAHQSSIVVGFGEGVSAGQVIGYVGSTGLSTGPHLHFEVRLNGSPVDPAPYL